MADEAMKNIVVCDIDGTIADLSHRLHYIRGEGKKDWNAFHAAVRDDKPHEDVREVLWSMRVRRRSVIYVSGRVEACRTATEDWLQIHAFPSGPLYMRADGDYRDDSIVKAEIIDRIGLTPEKVLFVLDDRDRVVRMWRERGFRVLQVAPGDF